ncbi:protein prenylyltransferase [Mytilinidion resinicola]|uniref:Geranylgeranyl transferase type-2 subunit alpha n=1 Tax=Mytilinidion resinicola TaxID=574789 RepID=A0A6A6YLL3_9PEZI|nr:protein prenylyltransferase [Mytilinidion resinicola]KAF2808757.1 protein prenylyltransferase [Mytilinidion resinicola]
MASHGVSRVAGSQTRSDLAREKELQQIARYNELVELVNRKVAERQYTVEVLSLTTKLLTENPEYYTIWNHRRRVLQHLFLSQTEPASLSSDKHQETLDFITADLSLTTSLLRQYPKCYWLWNHRYWVLQVGEARLQAVAARKLWQGELQLVTMMLGADSRNFHAWSYRRFVVGELERIPAQPNEVVPSKQSMVEAEFAYTTKMIKANLSNFSAWHNRSKLIPKLLDERESDDVARRRMLDDEFALIHEAFLDPFDQSIWYYHQFLMSTLSSRNSRESAIILDLTDTDRKRYCEQEINFIKDILEDEEDCKWIYEVLIQYSTSFPSLNGNESIITADDLREWLSKLRGLDPLRHGRWADLEYTLGL